ncbi:MAG: class I SAM-dependent rRNA methyltransferase [Boseongicola sp.]|nr:class I SAM-dependent rRNA methyltransferase [Boseongicola sp.]MDD9978619.1 class I SAM-dependent rRNA methyltransferase [Boseongicola sp.]
MTSMRPSVRLRPKVDARRILRGAPWVYSNELVTDRRTKALAPGTIATLEDAERTPIATVAVNPNSKIIARVLDQSADASIDRDWLADRLKAAIALREMAFDAPFYRLIHAEADGLPGVIIDRFGDALVVQPNAAWADVLFDDLVAALQKTTGAETIVKNASGRARGLEGLDDVSEVVVGSLNGPVPVPMNGAIYMADLLGGQKTGLFFDQRPNHAFVAGLSSGQDILDVFSHVGGFALAALAAGAKTATSVDGSEAALDLAKAGAEAMGVSETFATIKGDAFDVMADLGQAGRTFGTVICDPPAFAPHKGALDAGLRAYENVARLASPLVNAGGTLTLCSCSHAADLRQFRTASVRGIGRAGRRAQILRTGFAGPDHPTHPHLAESGYLKSVTFRLLP